MQSTTIDATSLSVSRLGLGTGSLHHMYWARDRSRVLEAAFDSGITHFDTSPLYGFGLAECEIGRVLSQRRGRLTIASKVGLYPSIELSRPSATCVYGAKVAGRIFPALARPVVDQSLATARRSLEQTLRRCRTDHLDLLLVHEPDFEVLDEDAFLSWFQDLERRGLIRSWGIAGEQSAVRPFVSTSHSISRVVQTRDSVEDCEADFVLSAGRPLQFTYGYMSRTEPSRRGAEVYQRALHRNRKGCVLFSTGSVERIEEIARACS